MTKQENTPYNHHPASRKTCTHCGKETYPQPQDFQHDKGYGHCSDCLTKEDWYAKYEFTNGDGLYLFLFHEKPRTSDDSHAKIAEVFSREGRCLYHCTHYLPTEDLLDRISSHFHTDFFEY